MDGYIQLRRGLTEHLRAGRLNLFELGVYAHLLFCADFRTGIQLNSAIHIYYSTGQQDPIRNIQRALECLEKAEYIKRFIVKGKKGDYPILIHRYEVTDGALKGQRLDALSTTTPSELVYFPSVDVDVDNDADGDVTLGGSLGDFGKNSVKNSNKNSKKNSETIPSLHSSPTVIETEIPEQTLTEILHKVFELPYNETYLPAMLECFSGQDPDELSAKILRFADWMTERFPSRLVSMRDFFHHWNNEGFSENGFRPQFEAFYRAEMKQEDEEASKIPLICYAPGCMNPGKHRIEEFQMTLCEACFRAFPKYAEHIQNNWTPVDQISKEITDEIDDWVEPDFGIKGPE